jgi:RNA polymerase sigma-70 factor (ECF subfamily)
VSQHVPLSQASFLDHVTSPSGAFSRAEQQRVVTEAIAGIDPEIRQSVELFYLYGYKVGEIAEALEIPLGTVKSRLFRGRAALKTWTTRRASWMRPSPAAAERAIAVPS